MIEFLVELGFKVSAKVRLLGTKSLVRKGYGTKCLEAVFYNRRTRVIATNRKRYAQLNAVKYSDDVGDDVLAMGYTGEYWIVVDYHDQNTKKCCKHCAQRSCFTALTFSLNFNNLSLNTWESQPDGRPVCQA